MALRTKTYSVASTGTSEVIDIEDSTDIKIAWMVSVVGTVTYTVEHSLDAINYIDNSDATNQTAGLDGNYILPIRAVRLKVTAGTGTATLVVRQLVI